MKKFKGAAIAMLMASSSFANGLTVSYKFEDADTEQKVRGQAEVSLPNLRSKTEMFYEVPQMHKTVTVLNLVNAIDDAIVSFEKTCNDFEEIKEDKKDEKKPTELGTIRPGLPRPILPGPIMPGPIEPIKRELSAKCKAEKLAVTEALDKALAEVEASLTEVEKGNFEALKALAAKEGRKFNTTASKKAAQERTVREHLVRAKKLSKLMKEAKPQFYYPRRFMMLEMAAAPSFNVTTGGAQDARKYRDLVDSDRIPGSDDFFAYGLINEFNLSLGTTCQDKFCMKPAVAYNPETGTLLVQAGMGTNVNPATFERKPINAGILIDISGSMSSRDNTAKSRLEWAKEAVQATLDNLIEGQDYISISTFTNDAELIWPKAGQPFRPITAKDKLEIAELVAAIKTQGSTNLNAGLDLSYKELMKVQKKLGFADTAAYNHRLIAITDANLNVDPDESGAVAQAEIMSETRGIDLTVVGVGLNFFQKFVDTLTTMRGGNYIFAQNGQDMVEYFEAFDTLVTSFAYDFVATLDFDETELEFVKVHGVPADKELEQVDNLMNIKTLFLTSSKNGGGARVLEFRLK